MTTSTVEIRTLRKGNLFYLDGERYALEYINGCRALVRPKALKDVVISSRKFRTHSEAFSISPATLVEIRREAKHGR